MDPACLLDWSACQKLDENAWLGTAKAGIDWKKALYGDFLTYAKRILGCEEEKINKNVEIHFLVRLGGT